jgi:hypothetical protein
MENNDTNKNMPPVDTRTSAPSLKIDRIRDLNK